MAGEIRFNPVPHNMTRPPRTTWQDYTGNRIRPSAAGVSENKLAAALSGSIMGAGATAAVKDMLAASLGRTYLGAITTGQTDSNDKKWSASTRPQWGCRFHYNPPGVSWGSGSTDGIDGADITAHSATLLGVQGTTSVSLELYFNRVFDMVGDPKGYSEPLGKDPATGADERKMILELGTQYDIEYLYRTINGNPQQDTTSLYPTSDWGVLIMAPVEVQLGPFRWSCVVDGLSVSHGMFTPDMVPTLSSVSLSLTRQITMQTTDAAATPTEAQTAASKKAAAAKAAAKATQTNNAKRTTRVLKGAQNREIQEMQQAGVAARRAAQSAASNPQTGAAAAAR